MSRNMNNDQLPTQSRRDRYEACAITDAMRAAAEVGE